MSRTPDAFDGPSFEEAVIWEEQNSDPATDKRLQFVQDKGLVILSDGMVRSIGETRAAIWQAEVEDVGIDDPPGSPSTGERVVIGDSPTGVFVGHEGEIAQYNGSAWVFSVPREGSVAFVKAHNEPYYQVSSGSPWVWSAGSTGGGITEATHKALRQLIHFIEDGPADGFASGAYRETTGTVFPTAIIWWESSSKLQKIVERTITWAGVNVTTDEWKIYDTDGTTLLVTVSDAISYSGVFETNRTRTITVH